MLALMPHGTCFLWDPWLTAFHVAGDMLTALAYFSIPPMLYLNRQHIAAPLRSIVLLFAAFILSCGVGHGIRVWNIWHSAYWLEGGWTWLTGLISLYTAVQLFFWIPKFLTTHADLTHTKNLLEKDILTGIANRRGLTRTVQALAQRVDFSSKVEHSLVLVDLDGFKQVNDTYGHQAGDTVLKAVAQLMTDRIRTIDLATRLGGDEFTILMVGCSPVEALTVAEGLCSAIAKIELSDLYPAPAFPLVTASIGIASLDPASSLEESFRKADKALYEAKHKGKNQVVLYSA